mgnify:FL=1
MYGVDICADCPGRKGKFADNEPAFIRPQLSQLQRRLFRHVYKITESSAQIEVLDEKQRRVARYIVPVQALGSGEIKAAFQACTQPSSLIGMKLCNAVFELNRKYETNDAGEK